jgi:hypothetical protein
VNCETAHFSFRVEIIVDADLLPIRTLVTGHINNIKLPLPGYIADKSGKWRTQRDFPQRVESGAIKWLLGVN